MVMVYSILFYANFTWNRYSSIITLIRLSNHNDITSSNQLVLVEVVMTAFIDQFPRYRHWRGKIVVIGTISTIGFLIGIILTTPVGVFDFITQ